jgi:hypothetical protein
VGIRINGRLDIFDITFYYLKPTGSQLFRFLKRLPQV